MRGFLDVLTNWYIRRSRDRFWGGESEESLAAFDTLWTALETVTRATAPLLPLVTEEIWRGLTGERSVHLTDYPTVQDLPADHELVVAMDRAREICSTGSSLRKARGLRARLPLGRADGRRCPSRRASSRSARSSRTSSTSSALTLVDVATASESDFGVTQRLTVNARAAGPRLGKDVQQAIKGSKSGDWSVDADGTVTAGGLALVEGEYALETVVAGDAGRQPAPRRCCPAGGFVVLDTTVTPELAAEGWPATSCAPSSRPAATPGCTSATGSA